VVEAGVYDAEPGTALVLANFTYQPIASLEIRLPVPRAVQSVRSVSRGPLAFTLEKADPADIAAGRPHQVRCQMDLGLTDIVLCQFESR
jgi:hypothetical protein